MSFLVIRAFLVVVLVMAVLFAWRAWGKHPGLAGLAAAAATFLAIFLLRSPVLVVIGLVLIGGLIGHYSRPRK